MTSLYQKILGEAPQDLEDELKDAILSKDPQGVIVINEQHKIVWVNDYFMKMFGYGWKSKVIDGKKDVDDFVVSRLRTGHSALLNDWFDNPREMKLESRHNNISGEHKDGTEIPLDIEIVPYERSDGLVLAIGFIREKSAP